ncbi:MAG: Holliday junction resolvase RecU [Streptococcaceae bacterium]|jgi:recombination protein U|nr:Holliday junction resolvase RecU [Streptococcaceae bacterium]
MSFRYPNGTLYHSVPNLKKKQTPKKSGFGKRGMSFEEEINQSNEYYLARGLAVIHKKPTPVQIVKVDYPQRSMAKITEAYFKTASTTDYNGVYQGKYIDFEAKETKNKTSFPFKNFHAHQITHMEQVLAQNGFCFVLLSFSSLSRIFLYPAEYLIHRYRKQEERKSIKLVDIENEGIEIIPAISPRIPYLQAIDEYFKNHEK